MIRLACISFFALLAISCKDTSAKHSNAKAPEKPSWNFDEITYFHSDITLAEIDNIRDKPEQTEPEQSLLSMLTDCPQQRQDYDSLETNLSQIYPVRRLLSAEEVERVKRIYQSKGTDLSATFCSPYYRDILLFKNNGVINAISKICFECDKSCMNTLGFGYNELRKDQLELLFRLLRPKNDTIQY